MARSSTSGQGRPKGSKNKNTIELRTMAFESIEELGGKDYLVEVGRNDPKAYLSFLGRFVPSEVKQTVTTSVSDMSDEELDAKIAEKISQLNNG